MAARRVPMWISGPLVLGTFALLFWCERRRALRRSVEPTLARTGRNLAVAAVSAVALQLTERPLISRLTDLVTSRRWGLLKLRRLPAWIEMPLAVVLLDYTLYVWHVLLHRSPFLWRLHVVHHVDLDLDTTTAIRFHFTELLISIGWRAGQVAIIGVSPLALSIWQMLLLLSVMFHHSNVRLPLAWERRVVKWIVTPRMHGIHHSIVRAETDSNWSSGLTLWDRLHGTLRLDVPEEQIIIGVPAYRAPREVTLGRLLGLPFSEQRPTWRFPDGRQPRRTRIEQAAPPALSVT